MTQPADKNSNPTHRGQAADFEVQRDSILAELRNYLDQARQHPNLTSEERDSLETDICLASRSAYFDFYTGLVLSGEIDKAAQEELDRLFLRALDVMRIDKFKSSVQSRYDEFRMKCDQARAGKMGHELASSDSRTAAV